MHGVDRSPLIRRTWIDDRRNATSTTLDALQSVQGRPHLVQLQSYGSDIDRPLLRELHCVNKVEGYESADLFGEERIGHPTIMQGEHCPIVKRRSSKLIAAAP